MTPKTFFQEQALPVFDFLSDGSKQALEAYIESGNASFRQKKLLEFFKSIDWMAADEPCNVRPLQKIPSRWQGQLLREIEDYRMQKAVRRVQDSEKREQYRLRVFEYFRIKMPSADKALLENLRDYELDLTGRDVNFRHYFTLDSFKKIDAFIAATHAERQQVFLRFKKDVDTYKKNYDKLHNPQYHRDECASAFTFDDWCDMMGEFNPHQSKRTNRGQQSVVNPLNNPLAQAYKTLKVEWNAPKEVVKRQFRQLTLTYHPDLPDGSEEKMKAIIGAYQEIQRAWQTMASSS